MIDILQGVVSRVVEFSLSTLAIVVCNIILKVLQIQALILL